MTLFGYQRSLPNLERAVGLSEWRQVEAGKVCYCSKRVAFDLFHPFFYARYVQFCSTSLVKGGLVPSTCEEDVSLVRWPESTDSN